jgi:hypothetical protein
MSSANNVVKSVAVQNIAFVVCVVAIMSIIAEYIGNVTFKLGTAVTLFPLLWALLGCIVVSVIMKRSDKTGINYLRTQTLSSDFVQIAIMLFIAKLGFIVGANIQKVIDQGWILLLQEVGNFLGTMALAMPIALILGIKREAVGATFSVGREPGVALIAEKYGMGSAEGRGVLAEYVTGTVIGAAFIAFFVSLVANTGIFSPDALGMAAGIGSGSMTAAAVGALAVQFPAEKDNIAALAAASNLLTTVVGTYILVVFSLPFSNWLYNKLEPILGKNAKAIVVEEDVKMRKALGDMNAEAKLPLWAVLTALILTAVISLVGNQVASQSKVSFADGVPGMLLLIACIIVGLALTKLFEKLKVPSIIWVSLAAVVISMPWSPIATTVNPLVNKLGILPVVTPVLAYAGLSLAKDLPVLKALGWRIIVVSLLANAGAFLAGAIIAQICGA